MRLYGNFREVLNLRPVLAHMFDPGLPEHRWHQSRAKFAFGRISRVSATWSAQKPLLTHLLDSDGERNVVHSRGDGHIRFAKCRRTGSTGIRDVHYGNSRLPQMLHYSLTDHHAGLIQIATREEFDVLDRDAGVLQRYQGRLRPHLRNVLFGIATKLDHARAKYINVSHCETLPISLTSNAIGDPAVVRPLRSCAVSRQHRG